jgi:gamma-glutamylputrescine oxidase
MSAAEIADAPRTWGITPWHQGRLPRTQTSMPSRADVVIVGAGLTGCSAAYHLATFGIRSVVLEADFAGSGASGRTGGIVLEGTAAGPLDQADACVPGLARLVEREHIACDLNLSGCWEIAHRADGVEMLPWTDQGKPVAVTAHVAGGTVEPVLLTLGIAQAALKTGVIIHEHTPVVRIDSRDQLTVESARGRIRADWVILAANAWTGSLFHGPRIASSLTFACASEPLEAKVLDAIGLRDGIPFYTADLPYLWGRVTAEGRVIFGSGLPFGEPATLEQTGVEEYTFAAALDALQERVRALHPALAKMRFSHAWAGPIAFTEDQVPVLSRAPRHGRLLVAGAYSGHGVAMSVHAGELLALAIAKTKLVPEWGALQG